ncbi:conserved exported hypothetical protein [Massilia sp. 9I]|nr:conserved exported hypothetical protein [Massilia sp. 9I]
MKTMFLVLLMMGASSLAAAQDPVGADGQLPPALRNRPATPPPAAGEALRAQALAKLEAQFKTADVDSNGSLTREEAKRFGFVARHFDEIDTARRGGVSFDDVRAYLARTKAERR